MRTSTVRGRLTRAALALLALVVGFGATTVAAPASPAQASGDYIMLCLPIFDRTGQKIIGWNCHPFELPREMNPCPPCPDWGFSFDHLVLPADPFYIEDVLKGLGLLEQAAFADPREAAALRSAAQAAFLSAAERLGDTEIRLGQAGIADRKNNVIRPEPDPWLVAAGTDVADGLTLMQQALANPDPTPYLAAGMAELEEAYQEIVQQQPVGR